MSESIETPDRTGASPSTVADAPADAPAPTFRERVAKVSAFLDQRRAKQGQRGMLAILRRLDPDADAPPPEEFWDVVHKFSLPPWEEDTWLRLLPLMARYPGRTGARPGRVFAAAGVSPARMERWLRADDPEQWRGVQGLLARVGDQGIAWPELAQTLQDWTPSARRTLARDYFRTLHGHERKES